MSSKSQILSSGRLYWDGTLPYLQLMRPANIVTAIADVVAGFAIVSSLSSAEHSFLPPLGLLLATIGLYGGGVVFNDIFDVDLDMKERPERPIPSGKVPLSSAFLLGGTLLIGGIASAWAVNVTAGVFASAIAAFALLYNSISKHNPFFGPLNMGLCRSGNLLLGAAAIPIVMEEIIYLGIIPLIYIFSITLVSQSEVRGGNRLFLFLGFLLYLLVVGGLLYLALNFNAFTFSIPFIGLLSLLIFPPLVKAFIFPKPKFIMRSVKMGVISLIVLNASIAVIFAGWLPALSIMFLLPVSLAISKFFAVT
ncbi:MAG: UbiA-like protein EboC [Cytophagaceae bacterium]